MRYLSILVLALASCTPEIELAPESIILDAIHRHDPSSRWAGAMLELHIQEPRVGDPYRYSTIKLDNTGEDFKLVRGRDEHTSTHIIDADGNARLLFDDSSEIDTVILREYRLDPTRNSDYRTFYRVLYGLPMSLPAVIADYGSVEKTTFNYRDAYRVKLTLREPIFTTEWQLYVAADYHQVLGLDIVDRDDPGQGERLIFSELVTANGMELLRVRHWYTLPEREYLGSDVIVTAKE